MARGTIDETGRGNYGWSNISGFSLTDLVIESHWKILLFQCAGIRLGASISQDDFFVCFLFFTGRKKKKTKLKVSWVGKHVLGLQVHWITKGNQSRDLMQKPEAGTLITGFLQAFWYSSGTAVQGWPSCFLACMPTSIIVVVCFSLVVKCCPKETPGKKSFLCFRVYHFGMAGQKLKVATWE